MKVWDVAPNENSIGGFLSVALPIKEMVIKAIEKLFVLARIEKTEKDF